MQPSLQETAFVRSILVYTHGEVVGDGIIQLPFAAALKQAAPDAKLTWLSSGYSVFGTIFKEMAQPIIDELIILPDHSLPWCDFLLRPKQLRQRQFDVIIDTERGWKRTIWLSRIRHQRLISVAAGGRFSSECLAAPSPHLFTRVMQLGSLALGGPLKAAPLSLPPGEWDQQAARLLPAGASYIGFVIGAGRPDKCWPLAQFIALAQQVTKQGLIPVMFLGPQETDQLAALRAALPEARFPLNETQAPSPYLTIALGRRLTAAIANDSGGGHLLAAADTPLVTLFRSATVRAKFMPHSLRVLALAPEDFGVASMQEIPLEAVSQALSDLIR